MDNTMARPALRLVLPDERAPLVRPEVQLLAELSGHMDVVQLVADDWRRWQCRPPECAAREQILTASWTRTRELAGDYQAWLHERIRHLLQAG